MSPADRMMMALGRIAALTSVARTRAADAQRLEDRGSTLTDLQQRTNDMANSLEALAADLERALA